MKQAITTKLIISTIALVALFVFSIPAALAVEYGGFGGRTAYPRPDNPRSESIFIHTAAPGTIINEGVQVINNSAETLDMLVYGADSTPSTDGAFACEQYSQEADDVGSWITLEQTEVTLEPGTNIVVPFTIAIPENAGVGSHDGCILIQKSGFDREGSTPGVNLAIRTGMRVSITIPGDIKKDLEIVGIAQKKGEKGRRVVSPSVFNAGNVSVDTDVALVTKSMFGFKHPKQGGEFPVLRGDTSVWNFEVPRSFWGGFYKSKLVVAYDADPTSTHLDTESPTLTHLETKTSWFFMMPTTLGLIIEIAILLVLLYVYWVYRKKRKFAAHVKKHWVRYEPQKGDTLQSIARERRISWEVLARVNKIKPPYDVSKRKLRVPPLRKKKQK